MTKLSSLLLNAPDHLIVRADAERVAHAVGNVAMLFLAPLSLFMEASRHMQGLPFAGHHLLAALLLLAAGFACRQYRNRLVVDKRNRALERVSEMRLFGKYLYRNKASRVAFDAIDRVTHLTRTEPRYSGVFVHTANGLSMQVELPSESALAPAVAAALGEAIGVPAHNAANDMRVATGAGAELSREALAALTNVGGTLPARSADADDTLEVQTITLWGSLPRYVDWLLALIPVTALALGSMLVHLTSPVLPPPVALFAGAAGLVAWGFARRAQVRRHHGITQAPPLRVDAHGIDLPSVVTADGRAERIDRASITRIEAQWSYSTRTRSDRERRAIDMGDIVLHLQDGGQRVLSLWHVSTANTLDALQRAGYTVIQAAQPTPVLRRLRWALVAISCGMLVGGVVLLLPQILWALT